MSKILKENMCNTLEVKFRNCADQDCTGVVNFACRMGLCQRALGTEVRMCFHLGAHRDAVQGDRGGMEEAREKAAQQAA